jgi:hypothetical protein
MINRLKAFHMRTIVSRILISSIGIMLAFTFASSGLASAQASPNITDASTCYNLVNDSGKGYQLDDAGVGHIEETDINSTCFTFSATGGFYQGSSIYLMKVNGGTDCLKVITSPVYDEGCNANSQAQQWLRISDGGDVYDFFNIATQEYMGTQGIGNGEQVFVTEAYNSETAWAITAK